MSNIGTPKMQCPHCGAVASCVKTSTFSNITRGKTYRCSDLECAFTFTTHEIINETLVMSLKPNPKVNIPFSANLKESLRMQADSFRLKQ